MNPEEILSCQSKKICVIAAPGAGKTFRVIKPKIEQLIYDGVDPSKILLLTFSRVSAKDLCSSFEDVNNSPKPSTVHSYCLRFLLSEDSHGIRERIDNIIFDFEKGVIVGDLNAELGFGKARIKKMLKEFSAAWAVTPESDLFNEVEEEIAFKRSLINWLVSHKGAMMEEIMYCAVDLGKRLKYSDFIDRPQYIIVDEYQDLNKLEQEFIKILSDKSELLLIVGDPDQSIYGFKYAYKHGIIDFSRQDDVANFGSSITGRCPVKIVNLANQLLQQESPVRDEWLISSSNVEAEINFFQKKFQVEEFEEAARDISERIAKGSLPKDFLILVPKKDLSSEFIEFVNANKARWPSLVNIKFSNLQKPQLGGEEMKAVLKIALLAKPGSILHFRSLLECILGPGYERDLFEMKNYYGDIARVIEHAKFEDFNSKRSRIRKVISSILEIKSYINNNAGKSLKEVVDEMFCPSLCENSKAASDLRKLWAAEDDFNGYLNKLVDYLSNDSLNNDEISVMTLMQSKGLGADHVYILGCNQGNMPSEKRSQHMSDEEFRKEQLRLLFVAFTRAKKSLFVSFSRYIKFSQSMNQKTPGLGVKIIDKVKYVRVGMSPFLQDLKGIIWK